MAHDYCTECGGELLVTNERLSNGDEITLLWCDTDGLYSVYEPETDSVVTTDDHDCPNDLTEFHHKRDNGDRLIFNYCDECGFYAADEAFEE